MRFVKNNTTYSVNQLRKLYPNVSIPEGVIDLSSFGYYPLVETPKPDPLPGNKVVEGSPVNNIQQWSQVPFTQEELNNIAKEEENSVLNDLQTMFKNDTNILNILNRTPQQVDTYVDGITSLAELRPVLKIMIRLIILLGRREFLKD